MNRIAFRVMGGKDIGYGHLYRCLALAKAITLKTKKYEIIFVVNKEITNIVRENNFKFIISKNFNNDLKIFKDLTIDLVVFDSYEADDVYLKSIKQVSKLVLIDDNNNIYNSKIPDIILNGNIHAKDLNYAKNESTRLLLGPEYLLMKEEYWITESNHNIEKKGVLITTGGTDPYNISLKILKKLKNVPITKIVIIGPGYSEETTAALYKHSDTKTIYIYKPISLKKYIQKAEFVITASGSTVYEVISQKRIPIIFSIAENQEIVYKYFQEFGIPTIGNNSNIQLNKIIPYLNHLQQIDIEKQLPLIDGKGAIRAAEYVVQCL